LYRVSNRHKSSGTNEVEHLYRARYSVQMPHICTAWSLGLVQMWDALSVSVSPPPSHLFFFSLFSFLSLFFFSRSQSRPHATHSQSQNIQPLIQIIYLTITYNSYTSHKLQDSQHILDHNIHNPFASHNISKTVDAKCALSANHTASRKA
jgi:hypothetical protein